MQKKKRILIVDDEQLILNILRTKLILSGYEVVTISNGKEALALIGSAQPDVMLLDVLMPGIDGFEVLRRLRMFTKLPVIVFSARPEYSQLALSLGANDFLAKPLELDKVVERIETLTKK
jgi:two-component system, OmpR family, KDP operon response regulator KdpE